MRPSPARGWRSPPTRPTRRVPWELLRDPRTDQPVALGAGRSSGPTTSRPAGAAPTRRRGAVAGAAGDLPSGRPGRRAVPVGGPPPGRSGRAAGRVLDLDVLRPPTFAALAACCGRRTGGPAVPRRALRRARHLRDRRRRAAGRRAVAVSATDCVSPGRAGAGTGTCLFEDPTTAGNQQLVDGPALGALLAETGVPVLVLNACRSAYAEAPPPPPDADRGGRCACPDPRLRLAGRGGRRRRACPVWWRCATASTSSPRPSSSPTSTRRCWPAAAGRGGHRRPAGSWPPTRPRDRLRPRRAAGLAGARRLRGRPDRLFAPAERRHVIIRRPWRPQAAAGPVPAAPPDVGFFGRDETLLGAGPGLRQPPDRAAARLRRRGQDHHRGRVRPLVRAPPAGCRPAGAVDLASSTTCR